MKKLIAAIMISIFLTMPAKALADPVDLTVMQEAGMSPETLGRYLAQNLDGARVAPQVDAKFLSRLCEYGGDELVASYLNLDKQTAHLSRRDFSPEVIEQLVSSDIGAANLKKVLDSEAVKAVNAAAESKPAAAPAPALSAPLTPPQPPAFIAESELAPPQALASARDAASTMAAPQAPTAALPSLSISETSIPAPPLSMPSAEKSVIPPPPVQVSALPPSLPPAAVAPSAPVIVAPQVAAPVMQQPQAPAAPAPQWTFQNLKPGQPADPGSRLHAPLNNYEIRQQPQDVRWMGVTERELPDGHRVEVNRMGNPKMVGQEVFDRPSGHKVYRYFSGSPDSPRPMVDPIQDQRNREDLNTIFQSRRQG